MTIKDKIDWRIIISAIVALTIIEVVALSKGINGTLLLLTMSAIAGLAGWIIPTPYSLRVMKGGK